tara:strand:- start:1 stop:633 length:633 start_codon:yes stop_codon:yes gene_type:complete
MFKKNQIEETLNTISHGITALTSIGGLAVLIVFGALSDKEWSLFSALFYGISLMLLYVFSTLYHGIKHKKTKHVFRVLDHCGIYLLIAGTYTPVILISIGGTTGWIIFGIQWGLALIGILLKIFYVGKFDILSTLMYLVMGWMVVVQWEKVINTLPNTAFNLLLAGGLAYSAGVIFYMLDSKLKYSHFIWHLFVMAGSILHYIMIITFII